MEEKAKAPAPASSGWLGGIASAIKRPLSFFSSSAVGKEEQLTDILDTIVADPQGPLEKKRAPSTATAVVYQQDRKDRDEAKKTSDASGAAEDKKKRTFWRTKTSDRIPAARGPNDDIVSGADDVVTAPSSTAEEARTDNAQSTEAENEGGGGPNSPEEKRKMNNSVDDASGAVMSSSTSLSSSSSSASSLPPGGDAPSPEAPRTIDSEAVKLENFRRLLGEDNIDMARLRTMSWNGVPWQVQGPVWQLLLGYLPTNKARREPTLERRRREFASNIQQWFDMSDANRSEAELVMIKQIRVDVPRTNPSMPFFQHPRIQESLIRILYIWAVHHPASGYVQGINDLVTPFFLVFLSSVQEMSWPDINPDTVTPAQLAIVEADCLWCLSKVTDGIQDDYTFAQKGIQRKVFHLNELIGRVDADLHAHFEQEGLQFIQFAFRWMNCLLMRELSFALIVRLWDSYLSEEKGDGFKTFHVYVCAALLLHFGDKLKTLEFQDLIIFLQHLPTDSWRVQDVETLLSQAFVIKHLYHDSPSHFQ